VVPASTYHDLTSKTVEPNLHPLYSPPGHPDGTVHNFRADAEAAQAVERIWGGLVACVHTQYRF